MSSVVDNVSSVQGVEPKKEIMGSDSVFVIPPPIRSHSVQSFLSDASIKENYRYDAYQYDYQCG